MQDAEAPKHGKIDPSNDPHVGGNQWAGGTGGRDTAGLGGLGGPYRLDAGHDVHQVPEEAKANVPEHIRKAAREMNRKAFAERLREIQMSEFDANLYDRCGDTELLAGMYNASFAVHFHVSHILGTHLRSGSRFRR